MGMKGEVHRDPPHVSFSERPPRPITHLMNNLDKGKPRESGGRKATGLRFAHAK